MPQSFDEAFPGGFEECVSTLGQEPSIDDPEALCGWLQENGFEALRETGADTILAGLEVEFVSVVDEPAQDSEWLLAKSADADEDEWTPGENTLRTADLLLKQEDDETRDDDEEPERKVWAAVLKPGEADAHGDLVPEPEIESAAHRYMKEYRKMDADHDLLDGEGVPIESYIVRGEPDVFETPDGKAREYPEGTWIMGAELSDEAWKRVEEGELTGFSIYGGAAKLDAAALLSEEQAKALSLAIGKRVDLDDMADAIQAFAEATGTDPTEASLQEFVEWVEENPDYDEEDEETEQETDTDEDEEEEDDEGDEDDAEEMSKTGVSPEVAEQAEQTLAAISKSMGDDSTDDGDGEQNDISETLTEIRDTVKNTNETVQKHDDRLDELRDDYDDLTEKVEETRKEVGLVEGDEGGDEAGADDGGDGGDGSEQGGETEKAVEELTEEIRNLRDDLSKDDDGGDDEGDVDRKTQKNAGVGGDGEGGDDEGNVEKSDDGLGEISFEGIASGEEA